MYVHALPHAVNKHTHDLIPHTRSNDFTVAQLLSSAISNQQYDYTSQNLSAMARTMGREIIVNGFALEMSNKQSTLFISSQCTTF